MRARIVGALRREAAESAAGRARWNELRDRLGDVAVSTVDAFCLSLLREFPLEADLDPDFGMADETEIPGLVDESVQLVLDAAARRGRIRDPALAMLLSRLGPRRCGDALRGLLERRLTAGEALRRSLHGAPPDPTGERACRRAATRIADSLAGLRTEVEPLVDLEGSDAVEAQILASDLRRAPAMVSAPPRVVRAWLERLRTAFLTRQGAPRKRFTRAGADAAARRRVQTLQATGWRRACTRCCRPSTGTSIASWRGPCGRSSTSPSRSTSRCCVPAPCSTSPVCCSGRWSCCAAWTSSPAPGSGWNRAYHHVLVDEFQDTSRMQWELVSLLVRSWGEGSGLVEEAPIKPSIFVVGDRKQSIYRFRDADVATFRDATAAIAGLRAAGDVRRSIAHSFRAVPELLGFCQRPVRRDWRRCAGKRPVQLRRTRPVSRCRAAGGRRRPGPRGRHRHRGMREHRGCGDRHAARRRAGAAQGRRRSARHAAGGRGHPVSHPRESHRGVRTRAHREGRADVRLQGPRVRGRRGDQGRPGAHPVSGPAVVRVARGGAAPLAHRPHVGRGPAGAWQAGMSAALVDPTRRPRGGVADDEEDRCMLDSGARRLCAIGWRWLDRLPPAELLDRVRARARPMHTSCAAPTRRRRRPISGASAAWSAASRTAVTRPWRACPTRSSGCPPACRTLSWRRSTP